MLNSISIVKIKSFIESENRFLTFLQNINVFFVCQETIKEPNSGSGSCCFMPIIRISRISSRLISLRRAFS